MALRVPELLLLLSILVLLFGANRLPALGAGLGRGLRSFKRAVSGGGGVPRVEG